MKSLGFFLLLIFISFSSCKNDEEVNDPFCYYDYKITVTNETEIEIEDCHLIHNNNPSCCPDLDVITCNTNLDDLDNTLLTIEPFTTIELKGKAKYNCDDPYCGGYGRFEFNSTLYPDIEVISAQDVYFTKEIAVTTSRPNPNIDLRLTKKFLDFEFEVDNQTDSLVHMYYKTMDELCHDDESVFLEVEPHSAISLALTTRILGGTCELRWGSYNFTVILYRNGTWPIDDYLIIDKDEVLKLIVTLDGSNQPIFSID